MPNTTYIGEGRWNSCNNCTRCESRRGVVLSRVGHVGDELTATKVLYIGDSPSSTDDIARLPFIGETGKYLNSIFNRITVPHSFCITHLVSCYGELPTPQEIEACKPKLDELIIYYKPQAIVFIGDKAKKYKTKLPTHTMSSISSIIAMEYPLYSVKEQALLLSRFLHALSNTKANTQGHH
jgi:uracil-DNA glycosylase family 4